MVLKLVFRPMQCGLRILQFAMSALQLALRAMQLTLRALQLSLQLGQLLNERTLFVIPSQSCLLMILAHALHF